MPYTSVPDYEKFCILKPPLGAQIQEHLEGPIGMALYEWKDGKIGTVCVQGGVHF